MGAPAGSLLASSAIAGGSLTGWGCALALLPMALSRWRWELAVEAMARRRPVVRDACVVCREGYRTCGVVFRQVRGAIDLVGCLKKSSRGQVICSLRIRTLVNTRQPDFQHRISRPCLQALHAFWARHASAEELSSCSCLNVTRETSELRVAMNTTNPLGGIHAALDRYEADGRPPAAELPPTRGAEAALLELGGSRPRFALAPEPRLSLERTDTA